MNDTDAAGVRPPEPSAPPVIGHALAYARDPLGFVDSVVSEHGPAVSFRMPGHEGVLFADPDAIEHVLVHGTDRYRKGDFQRRELSGLLGEGLLISEGKQWESARETVQPAFRPGRIADHADAMVDCARRHISGLERGDTVDIGAVTSAITLSILGEVLFDTTFEEAPAVRDAAEAVTSRFAPDAKLPMYVPDWVPTPRNLRYRRAVHRIDEFVADLIAERRAEALTRKDLLSLLLASDMDDGEIRDHLVTFLLAGHETTALALTYTLYCLATNPEEQSAVAAEISDLDGDLADAAANSFPRTDRAIREAMRLYPPVHLIMREAVEDDVAAGYRVPEGALVICSQWATHRRAEFYNDPACFRPDRWADAEAPRFAYFPFGGGPRACIGRRLALLEARLVLSTILDSFRIEPETENLDLAASMTLSPTHPVRVKLVERS